MYYLGGAYWCQLANAIEYPACYNLTYKQSNYFDCLFFAIAAVISPVLFVRQTQGTMY